MDRAPFTLQLVSWLGLSGVYYALDLAALLEHGDPVDPWELAVRAGFWGGCGWLVSIGAWTLWRRFALETSTAIVAVAAGGGLLFGVVWMVGFHWLDGFIALEPGYRPLLEWSAVEFLAEGVTFTFPMMAWHGVALTVRQAEHRANDRARVVETERLLAQAELDGLRYQLNPHLIFNAINSAIALIDEDPQRAETMLLGMTQLLRAALRAPRAGTVADELDRVRAYLELEHVRFESRLDASVHADDVEAEPLPTLLVQPLVENAIKHGMQRSPMPLRVRIDLTRHSKGLDVRVANTGTLGGPSSNEGHGVGLSNVRARVRAHYGPGSTLTVEETTRDGDAWVEAWLHLVGTPKHLADDEGPPT